MSIDRWIMSEGGPLIAVERELKESWGGICRLTVPAAGAANDYDRPPEKLNYLQTVQLQHGQGLIFGEGPVDTSFWQDSDQQTFIIRPIYCEPELDFDKLMRDFDRTLFENPIEKLDFTFFSGNVLIFDSADDGSYPDVMTVGVTISRGLYSISTIVHEPDENACVIIHKFSKIGEVEILIK